MRRAARSPIASYSNAGWARRDRREGSVGPSERSVVLRGQSFFRRQSVVLIVVVSRRGHSTWLLWSVVVVSCSSWSVSVLLGCRGQSSWSVILRVQSSWSSLLSLRSVVLRGWCLYSMTVMHMYLLRHMAGENRGQCLDKCTGVGRTRVRGH